MPEPEQSLAAKLRSWVGMQTQAEHAAAGTQNKADRYADVATRFGTEGCSAISNAQDQKTLKDYAAEPATTKYKVPGREQLNTAVQTCKPGGVG